MLNISIGELFIIEQKNRAKHIKYMLNIWWNLKLQEKINKFKERLNAVHAGKTKRVEGKGQD